MRTAWRLLAIVWFAIVSAFSCASAPVVHAPEGRTAPVVKVTGTAKATSHQQLKNALGPADECEFSRSDDPQCPFRGTCRMDEIHMVMHVQVCTEQTQ